MTKRNNLEGFGGLVFAEMDFGTGSTLPAPYDGSTAYFVVNRPKAITHNGNTYYPINGAFLITGLAEELDPTTSVQMILHPNFPNSRDLLSNPVPPITVRIIIVFTRNNSDAVENRFDEALIHQGILTNGRDEGQGVTFDITPENLGANQGSPEYYTAEDHERNYPTDHILRNRKNLRGKERRAPS